MKIIIDLSEIEEADDGNTTYYGGTFKVGDQVLQADGNDRNGGYQDAVFDELSKQLPHSGMPQKKLGKLIEESLEKTPSSHWSAGSVYEVSVDGEEVTIKELEESEAKLPSKDEALFWLKAMGIEYKEVKGKAVVKISDKEKIKKIFGGIQKTKAVAKTKADEIKEFLKKNALPIKRSVEEDEDTVYLDEFHFIMWVDDKSKWYFGAFDPDENHESVDIASSKTLDGLLKDIKEIFGSKTHSAVEKLSEQIESLMSELVCALTDEATGIDGHDEKQLQEYGENSYFASHGHQQEEVYHNTPVKNLLSLFKKHTQSRYAGDFTELLNKIIAKLSNAGWNLNTSESQIMNACMQEIVDLLETLEHRG